MDPVYFTKTGLQQTSADSILPFSDKFKKALVPFVHFTLKFKLLSVILRHLLKPCHMFGECYWNGPRLSTGNVWTLSQTNYSSCSIPCWTRILPCYWTKHLQLYNNLPLPARMYYKVGVFKIGLKTCLLNLSQYDLERLDLYAELV